MKSEELSKKKVVNFEKNLCPLKNWHSSMCMFLGKKTDSSEELFDNFSFVITVQFQLI